MRRVKYTHSKKMEPSPPRYEGRYAFVISLIMAMLILNRTAFDLILERTGQTNASAVP